MKTFVSAALLMIGFVLLAGGNAWGFIGMIPALFQLITDDSELTHPEILDQDDCS